MNASSPLNSMELSELQRLLDGAMNQDDRQLFLQQADEHPERWRQIALAFVEEQVLREELSDLSSELLVDANAGEHGRAKVSEATTHLPSSADTSRKDSRRSSSFFLAQAAVLLAVLGLGTAVGRYSWPKTIAEPYVMWLESDETVNAPNSTESNASSVLATGNRVSKQQSIGEFSTQQRSQNAPRAVHTFANQTHQDPLRQTQNALFSPNDRASTSLTNLRQTYHLVSAPLFDVESRQTLVNHGFIVKEEPVIYLVEGDDGEQYIMPHRRVSLRRQPNSTP